ncbi:MAG: zinc-ribbon and DUF3426 domain-containing protein [Rubrivivax sp.]
MSLATRCRACGTVFRVVQDQLRVSDGWVRCGRCSEVFNAVEHLVDLSLHTPGEAGPGAVVPRAPAAAPSLAPSVDGEPTPAWIEDTVVDPGPVEAIDPSAPLDVDLAAIEAMPATAVAVAVAEPESGVGVFDRDDSAWHGSAEKTLIEASDEALDDAPQEWPDEASVGEPLDPEPVGEPVELGVLGTRHAAEQADADDDPLPSDFGDGLEESEQSVRGGASGAADLDGGPVPSRDDPVAEDGGHGDAAGPAPRFLRDAERAARWRQPRVRAALAGAALVAGAVLLLQVVLVQHDLVAARWPTLRPVASALCDVTGCRVEPPRRIQSLTVDSSALVRAPDGGGTYRLAVVLRNHDTRVVRTPAVELSLTDALGQTVARRVLEPAELGARGAGIGAGSELSLATLLRSADPAVAGYTIEIFYP